MKLIQSPSQLQQLSQFQLQSVEVLQMSAEELDAYIRELSLSNPMIEPEEVSLPPADSRGEALLLRLRWLKDNDWQNRYYQRREEPLDPLAFVGTEGGLEETLFRALSRQIRQLRLDEDTAEAVRYLAACLDDSGYLRVPLEELAEELHTPISLLERSLSILQSLEPPGVGARDLSQCLSLQLERLGQGGAALTIVRDHLEPLAKRHYRLIAARMGIPVEEVQAAAQLIQSLQPRPGAVLQREGTAPYILPDVFVEEKDGRLAARTRRGGRPAFQINSYYRGLLDRSGDQEIREYLMTKLRHAENILRAVSQRESTLQSCAQVIADRQEAFFRDGPCALRPLRMADAALELGVHESTVSRTVHEKYLQCARGIYPMSYFFSRPSTAESDFSRAAAWVLLRQLIEREDKRRPLSDQSLSEEMARNGCPISRRTVAKYREEMEIPSASGRRAYG
ncbi:MAG: RNA polymerase factor sigma-54 [Oscillospiraceae bacterium]|nr:RNA polymerase factor sigma-54 [Oscillospiraceae bacterium]